MSLTSLERNFTWRATELKGILTRIAVGLELIRRRFYILCPLIWWTARAASYIFVVLNNAQRNRDTCESIKVDMHQIGAPATLSG